MWQIKKFLIFFCLCCIVSIVMYLTAKLLSSHFVLNKQQLSEYECGFEAFDNTTRKPFDIQFYLVGILFVLFDVEIAMLFPWVINYFYLDLASYLTGVLFISFIIYGVLYEWQTGIINWATKKNGMFLSKCIIKASEIVFSTLSKLNKLEWVIIAIVFSLLILQEGIENKKLKIIFKKLLHKICLLITVFFLFLITLDTVFSDEYSSKWLKSFSLPKLNLFENSFFTFNLTIFFFFCILWFFFLYIFLTKT